MRFRKPTRRTPGIVALAIVATLAGTGAYAGVRLLKEPVVQAVTRGDARAAGQPTPGTPFADATGTAEAAGAAILADAAKPEFAGTLNGIVMYPGSTVGPEFPCTEAELTHKGIAAATGTPFAIFERGLPAGLAADPAEPAVVALCSGKLRASGGGFVVSATNHLVLINRTLRPSPWNYAYGPADRVSASTISNRPAVLTRSVLADGRGGSYLTFVEQLPGGYLVTELRGPNAPISELIQVAQELAK